jgi:OmpA-OmpF porin, OOP family
MRNILLTVVTTIGLFAATNTIEAAPQEGPYVSALGGVSFLDADTVNNFRSDVSTGYLFGGALGYKFCSPLRVEGEFVYRHNTIKELRFADQKYKVDFDINTYSYMANAYYDFDLGCPFTPYLGAGIGYVHSEGKAKVDGQTVRTSSNGYGAQGIAGVSYAIDCKTDIALEYRYLYAHENAKDHGVCLNVRRYF